MISALRKTVHMSGAPLATSACGKRDVITTTIADSVTCGGCRGTARYVAAEHPLPKGHEGTLPERCECPHGEQWRWYRWTWRPDRGSVETSDAEILANPTSCHACNCDDPFCPKCDNPL